MTKQNTMMIAMQCPVCGSYMEQSVDDQYYCKNCWAELTTACVRESPWGQRKAKERDRLLGIVREE